MRLGIIAEILEMAILVVRVGTMEINREESMKSPRTTNSEQIIKFLLRLAPHTRISRHVPGRIQLKLDFSGLGIIGGYDLEKMVRSIPSILRTDTRLLSRSVVITYDPARLPYELWEALAQLRDKPQQAPQVRALLEKALQSQSV